jgi:hypothetical protein
MRTLVLIIAALVCGSCPAAEPIGQSGKPVTTQPNPTFSNPAGHVAPMATPNSYVGRNGRPVINKPIGGTVQLRH